MTEYFDIAVELKNPLEEKIAEAFQVYDHDNVKIVDARDVGAIVRSLGCVPTEDDIQELIVKKTEFANQPGNIPLSKFLPCLSELLVDKKMKPLPPEALLEAFKVLDEEDNGFIQKDLFLKIMTDVGEPMTAEELNEMIKVAVDPADQNIYYESYINQLCHEPEQKDSIYGLAELFHKPLQNTRRLEAKFM